MTANSAEWRVSRKALEKHLAELYPSMAQAGRILDAANIDSHRVSRQLSPIDMWHEILRLTERDQIKLRDLLSELAEDTPTPLLFEALAALTPNPEGSGTGGGEVSRHPTVGLHIGEAPATLLLQLRNRIRTQTSSEVARSTNKGEIDLQWHAGQGPRFELRPDGGLALSDPITIGSGVHDLHQYMRTTAPAHLVILGAPQSGKTTVSGLLANQMLSDWNVEEPAVPISFRLARWNPQREELQSWMLRYIKVVYGFRRSKDMGVMKYLLENGYILPVLDGFDELRPESRDRAAERIVAECAQIGCIVTSTYFAGRREYRTENLLSDAFVVHLQPLSAEQVGGYLGIAAESAWDRALKEEAGHDLAMESALGTPLLAWLAKTVYLGKVAGSEDSESELREIVEAGPVRLEHELVGQLIPAVFAAEQVHPTRGPTARRYTPSDAKYWLINIAMSYSPTGRVAFWELARLIPLRRLGCAYGIAVGLVVAVLVARSTLIGMQAAVGPFLGVVFGFGFARGYANARSTGPSDPSRLGYGDLYYDTEPGIRIHFGRLVEGLGVAGLIYVVAAFATWFMAVLLQPTVLSEIVDNPQWRRFWVGALLAGAGLLIVAYLGAQFSARVLLWVPWLDGRVGARASTPMAAVKGDRLSGAGMLGLAFVVVVLATGVLTLVNGYSLNPGLAVGGILGALAATFIWNEWLRYKLAHVWTASIGRLPWWYQDFLLASDDLGVLKQNGNVYVYRHANLRDGLRAA